LAAGLVTSLGVAAQAADAAPVADAAPAALVPMAIDRTNQAAVANAYINTMIPALSTPITWNGNKANCVTGSPTAQPSSASGTANATVQAATLKAINYYREMAGLQPVTENSTGTHYAMQAALIMHAQGDLNHTPPTSWACYSSDGAAGAGSSNLSLGSIGPGAIKGQMSDSGSGNTDVGHRRWILYPPLSQVGMGSTSSSMALKVFGTGTANGNTRPSGGTAWPSAGYFPYEIYPGSGRWSFTLPSANFSAATVTVKKGSTTLATSVIARNGGYGDPALAWTVSGVTQPAQNAVDIYTVTISGVTGVSPSSYTYQVKLFNAAVAKVSSVSLSGTAQVGQTLTASVGSRTPSDGTVGYVWLRDGSPIYSGNTYVVRVADAGHKLSVQVTVSKAFWSSFPQTSSQVTVPAMPTVSGQVGHYQGASLAGWVVTYNNYDCSTHKDISSPIDVYGTVTLTAAGTFSVPVPAGQCTLIGVRDPSFNFMSATYKGSRNAIYIAAGTSNVLLYVGTPPAGMSVQGPKESFTLSPDMNGDGRGEILAVAADYGQLWGYAYSAAGTIPADGLLLAGTPVSGQRIFGPGDWNGDGRADVVTVDKSGYMWLYAGNGYGTVGNRVEIGHGWTPFRIIPAGDLTQDGANDMLAIDAQGRLWLYAGNGKGGWKGQPKQVGQGWVGLELYAAGDLNNDGKNDILAILPDSTLWAYSGRGNGTFSVPKQVGRGWGAFELAAGADLNGDGRADIVGRNNATGELFFYRGNGGGSFQAAVKIASGW
jgi:uncharacterized protein YkwD